MDNELYQLLLSLKIGDGCYITQSRNRNTYSLKSSSVNTDYLKYKKDVLSKFGIVVRIQNVILVIKKAVNLRDLIQE